MIFNFALGFKNKDFLILNLQFSEDFLTEVKLSPDCPLVEVLKEPRNDIKIS